jgi:hypothetical protein
VLFLSEFLRKKNPSAFLRKFNDFTKMAKNVRKNSLNVTVKWKDIWALGVYIGWSVFVWENFKLKN